MSRALPRWARAMRLLGLCVGCAVVVACSSTSRPEPAKIQDFAVLQDVKVNWTVKVGDVNLPLVVSARDDRIALANDDGVVIVLDPQTGQDIWRVKLNQPLSSGVGSDGQQVAVVSRSNELIALQNGRVQWRSQLPAESFTPPLVAGARVFVLTANRSVIAFDGATGKQLWSQQRAGDPLVLKQAGVLLAFKNTLLVGLSGRMAGLDPDRGVILWETAMANPRGINDIERLVDLVAPYDRQGDVVCVRAFQTSIGCVDAQKGQNVWTRSSVGEVGVSGNDRLLIAPMSNGVVQAFHRGTGERVWESERLKYRSLSAPLVTPRGVLVADNGGWLSVLSLADGALLNHLKLGSEGLAAAPVLAGGRYVVVTRDGRVMGLQIP